MDSFLDSLLKEALTTELRDRRGKGSVTRLEEIKRVCHATYTNPDNWLLTKTIDLIERSSGSLLGTFQVYQHTKVAARKLLRCTEVVQADGVEYVEGQEWLGGPFMHEVDPPSEEEIRQVRSYFHPHYWRPAWLHLKGKRKPAKSGDELLSELFQ